MAQTKAHEPRRRPVVWFEKGKLDTDVLALLRMSWFLEGRLHLVEEFTVWQFEGGPLVVRTAIQQAIEQGYDLTVLSEYEPAYFGVC